MTYVRSASRPKDSEVRQPDVEKSGPARPVSASPTNDDGRTHHAKLTPCLWFDTCRRGRHVLHVGVQELIVSVAHFGEGGPHRPAR
jgi:hypothetical protein